MTEVHRSIFRTDAVRRYLQTREKSVLPQLVSPRTFAHLWILIGLLITTGLLVLSTQIPVRVSGTAVIVDREGRGVQDDIMLAAFLPPASLSELRVEQTMFLHLDTPGERWSSRVIAIEPEVIGPEAALNRFALGPGTTQVITQPAAVAIGRLESMPTSLPAAAYIGSVYRVDVEVGSRRIISLLPLIGQLFHGE